MAGKDIVKADKNTLMFDNNIAQMQSNFSLRKHTAIYKILQHIPEHARVLDIGCAWGYLGQLLAPKHCVVTGIEIDEVEGKKAQQYCQRVIVSDLEDGQKITQALGQARFDAIVCSDVLEHLSRPDIMLGWVKELLAPQGRLYVSLPNIARIEHRLNLLRGKFDYEDAGILCKSHLRFFTRATAILLLEQAGFVVERTEYTGFASMVPLFPTLTAYQFVFTAKAQA